MNIVLLSIGKTKERYLLKGIDIYLNRLKYYNNIKLIELPNIKNIKNLSKKDLLLREGDMILKNINQLDHIVLLDSKGKHYNSLNFSSKLQKWMFSSNKRLVFVIGGAYGFSEHIYNRANESLSLSDMTFSHQMVRLFFLEQLYRAYTILNNHPYHNN